MRKNILFGAVGFGMAGLFLAGPVASAGQLGNLNFTMPSYTPGQEVRMTGDCGAAGWHKAAVHSTALEPGSAVGFTQPGVSYDIVGVAKVKKDVKPGTYAVSFNCGNKKVSANLTVVASGKPQPTTSKPATSKPAPTKAKEAGQVAVKPKGAADTGEGDVAVEAAATPESSGPGAGLYALGGAGLLAAGGAGAFMLRRRSRA